MGLTQDGGLRLVERDQADVRTSSFCFRSSKVEVPGGMLLRLQAKRLSSSEWHLSNLCLQEKLDPATRTNADGTGSPEIKYGDSVCYLQHVDSGLWLTYRSADAKSARLGSARRKVSLRHD